MCYEWAWKRRDVLPRGWENDTSVDGLLCCFCGTWLLSLLLQRVSWIPCCQVLVWTRSDWEHSRAHRNGLKAVPSEHRGQGL